MLVVAVVIRQVAARLDRRIDLDRTEADRRAMHTAMDTFRTEMQRLAERQVRTEVRIEEHRTATGAD